MRMFKHVYNVSYVYSSAGEVIGISIEQYCVISCCNITASSYV